VVDDARSSTLAEWPAPDAEGWRIACTPAARLRRGGAASRMKPSTQATHVRGYGYFLAYCARAGHVASDSKAASLVTPERVQGFLAELEQRVGSVTRCAYVQRIRRVAEILAPERDFGWLREIEADLQHAARPRAKYPRIVDSERLFELGMALMVRAEDQARDLSRFERARLFRNGLMIAILTLCPIRLANLHGLRVAKHVCQIDGHWWIILDRVETKSGRPDERPIHPILTPFIERWINNWRETFGHAGDHMWPSPKGGRLAYTYVGAIVTETTRRELGVAVNPHLFRDCCVHTIADRDGANMGTASALLQHIDPRVTEKHYNKGASFEAARKFARMLGESVE
jgi:integrase